MASQTFFPELTEDAAAAASERNAAVAAGYDTCRTWADPQSSTEIVGVDFGGGAMHCHFLRAGNDMAGIPLSGSLQYLRTLKRGTLIVAERAHMAVPQTAKSLAQPFTEEELLDFYSACDASGLTLRLFPHAHTRKAREWVAANAPDGFVEREKSTDINDARAIAFYVAHFNGNALAAPPKDFRFTDNRRYGAFVRRRSNVVLAAMKSRGYDGQVFPEIVAFASRLHNAVGGVGSFVHCKAAISIASTVVGYHSDGLSRFTYKGRAPGVNFWKRNVLMMTPNHRRGGIARANLCRDRFRPFFAEFADARGVTVKVGPRYIPFGDFTPELENCRRDAWRQVRADLKNAYRVAVEMSSGLPSCDLLSIDAEAFTHA